MFLQHIHNFRTVAILGIVGAHSLHNFAWPEGSLSFRLFDALFNQASIWFFFIAGLLFQYLSSRYESQKYFIGKFKTVILPYLLLSIPALIASVTFYKQDVPASFYDKSMFEQIGLLLLTGKHLAPFWFVPTISLIYLLAPLLVKADRARWPYWLLPPLVLLSVIIGRDGLIELTPLSGYYSPFSKALYLFSIYYFGMFCGRYHEQLMAWLEKYHLAVLVLALLSLSADVLLASDQKPIYFIYLFKFFTCMLFVYWLSLSWARRALDRFAYVGTVSFGIFFLHGYLLAAIKMGASRVTGASTLPASVWAYLLFILAITAACCLALVIAQRLFGKRSRMLVGA